jgi:hypothetical protein
MTKREVVGRYKGSAMGLVWSFLNPVFLLAVYTFVFSVVFKARWGGGGEESKTQFAVVLFVGMIVHGLFAEVLNRAPGLILGNVNYVKKVVFPLEILPFVGLLSALYHALISLLVWLVSLYSISIDPIWPYCVKSNQTSLLCMQTWLPLEIGRSILKVLTSWSCCRRRLVAMITMNLFATTLNHLVWCWMPSSSIGCHIWSTSVPL